MVGTDRTSEHELEFTQDLSQRDREIFTPDAIAFLADLVREFGTRRDELLGARQEWQARIDAGELPSFRTDTEDLRRGHWKVAPLPTPLQDRRVEITGPADPKMVINALNANVRVFMADFEDALSPTWANVVEGQHALKAAIERTLTYDDPATGKHYELGDDPAILIARVRGLHLDEKHILLDGKPVPGALVDFGLYYHHNHQSTCDIGHGPYFYVPKLEHMEEAQWWDDVFCYAQNRYGQPAGTIKATMLIETLPAVFEMEEILYALRNHAAGLNCGRWDYIFSYIKTLKSKPDRLLPDRSTVTMDKPFLDAYSRLLIKTCHKRGALAMGGMSAFIPRKDDGENQRVLEKVRADKQLEADNGHDGSWIAHPGLAEVVNDVYSKAFPAGETNQIRVMRDEDVQTQPDELLEPPQGPCTEDGLRTNIRVAIQYLAAWLDGAGAVAIYGLMEDAATAEISRASIWQWIKHGAVLDNGEQMTAALFNKVLGEEMSVVKDQVGADVWSDGRFEEAGEIIRDLCTREEFESFLTLPAYERL
jgi:malate synthase